MFYLLSNNPDLNPDRRRNAELTYALGSSVQMCTKDKLKEVTKAHWNLLEDSPNACEIDGGLKRCEGKLAHLGIQAPARASLP
jgi:hypothetical protein